MHLNAFIAILVPKLKGSVHKLDQCSTCSFGNTRLKFTRFTWRFCQCWACLCNVYTVTLGSTSRLRISRPSCYNVIMCICL